MLFSISYQKLLNWELFNVNLLICKRTELSAWDEDTINASVDPPKLLFVAVFICMFVCLVVLIKF